MRSGGKPSTVSGLGSSLTSSGGDQATIRLALFCWSRVSLYATHSGYACGMYCRSITVAPPVVTGSATVAATSDAPAGQTLLDVGGDWLTAGEDEEDIDLREAELGRFDEPGPAVAQARAGRTGHKGRGAHEGANG